MDRASVEKLLEAVAHRWADGENEVDLRIDAEKLDQVNIISRWLEDQGDDASTIALGPGWVNGGFAAVVDRVMEAARIAARGVG